MTSFEQRDPLRGNKNIPSPNDNARAYARFIPREELNDFAAWQPGDIAGGPTPQANIHRATEETPKADVAAQLAAQLRAARQAGYQDGYRDGLVALDGFKQSYAAQTTAQIGALLASVGAQLEALQQDMARTLAVSATHLARQIVRSELATNPALVAAVAQEAIDTLLLSAKHITLRVHPDDHPFVAEGAAEVLAARGGRLLSDATMARGGVLVESDIGVVDATVETRWRRAAASLGCEEGWTDEPAAEADGE
ncbi:MAG: flagellar assembly protein FliH [Pseudomonadota bacterium]